MDTVALLARVGLAAVFAVAALAKLRRLDAVEVMAAALRVPATRAAAVALVAVEAGVAVLLVAMPDSPAGPVGAIALAAVFAAAALTAQRSGRAVTCACFGATARPLGRRQLRQAPLLVAAALLGLVGTPDAAVAGVGLIAAVLGAHAVLLAAAVRPARADRLALAGSWPT